MLSLACSPDGAVIYAGSYAGLWTSTDKGANWEQLTWPQPAADQFETPGALGGSCVVDIAVGPGWRVDRHPRLVVPLKRGGPAAIVGFGDSGVWTALGDGVGAFAPPKVVMSNFGFQAGGWTVDRHPRFTAVLTRSGFTDLVGFGDAGVWTALGNGDGTFQAAKYVLANFGYDQGWRVDRHPRFLAVLTRSGFADIVGFGDAGVWTALGNGDGTFQDAKYVVPNLGYNQGWRVDRHPRFVAVLTKSGLADLVGFGDAGVWTALGNGDGTFQEPKYVLADFGYNQGWRVDQHPRSLAVLTASGVADIVGFGNGGVCTAVGKGDGSFNLSANPVLANFGYDQAWRVDAHPRMTASLRPGGRADIVGFGDAGVWTALGTGDGRFSDARFVQANFGVDQGWRVDQHPRFAVSLAPGAGAAIVGFGEAGVWTAIGDGAGGFPNANYVLANFGHGLTVLALMANDLAVDSRGLWRSTDGGSNWTQVHRFPGAQNVGQIEWATGSDHLVYAAGPGPLAISGNGGATFQAVSPWPSKTYLQATHIALWQNEPSDPAPAVLYAVCASGMSVSFDGGLNWIEDQGALPAGVGGGTTVTANYNTPKVMVVSPRFPLEVILAGDGSSAFTPAALWRGDFTQFPFGDHKSSWSPVGLPDALEQNAGDVFQDSGNVFLATTRHNRGDLLFYGAQRSVAYVGRLSASQASDWRRLDDGGHVHYDLHGFLLSPDYQGEFNTSGYRSLAGMVWMASDGGLYGSADGGKSFNKGSGVKTLSVVNVGAALLQGHGPAFSLNQGDNDGFYSTNGGQHWSYQQYGGGDNDCSFADPLVPNSMLVFTPRWDTAGNLAPHTRDGQTVAAYQTSPGHLPDASHSGHDRVAVVGPPTIPDTAPSAPAVWNASSTFGLRGSRPIVYGLPTETPPAQGDYVFILYFIGAPSVVVRTQNIKDIKHRSEWVTTATGPGQGANVYLQGPPLPVSDLGILQAVGGHGATQFYVGGGAGATLWKGASGASAWTQIVPAPVLPNSVGAQQAIRFFASPYQPSVIYILDSDHVKRSDDGGATWQVDQSLETQLTWNGRIAISTSEDSSGIGDHLDVILTDMQFDPFNDTVRFAVGLGGAFCTTDGVNWTRLLHSEALPGRPANCLYDAITNGDDPALYVSFAGRSLVKLTDLPPPPIIIF